MNPTQGARFRPVHHSHPSPRKSSVEPGRTKHFSIAFIAIGVSVLLLAVSLYIFDLMVHDRLALASIAWLTGLVLSPVLLTGLMWRWRNLPVARSHPWEVFLLLGVPAWMAWLSALATPLAGWLHVAGWPSVSLQWLVVVLNASIIATAVLVVLAATYPWVRRYGHELLKLLWEVHIMLSIGTLAFWLTPLLLGYGHPYSGVTILTLPLGSDSWDALYHLSLNGLFSLVVVVWFMRRAARASRPHAFLLLALAGISLSFNYQWLFSEIVSPDGQGFATALWQVATAVGMNVLLLWALIRYVDKPPVRLVAVLLALPVLRELGLLGIPLYELWSSWGWSPRYTAWVLQVVLQPLPVLVLGYWFTRPRRRSQ